MRKLWLIIMTSLLTILTWIVADYSLSDTATIQVQLTPVSGGGNDMRILPVGETEEPFKIQVTGRKTVIAQLKSRDSIAIRVPVSRRASGIYTLRLIDELQGHPGELDDVIVQSVSPPTLDILVDRNKTVMMPIQVQPGSLEYEGPVIAEPTEVAVTISELAYNELPPTDRRVLLYPDEHLRTAPRGKLLTTSVHLTEMVGDYSVSLEPDIVTLRFKLIEELQEETISAVPIKIEASLDMFNGYRVEVRDAGAVLTRPVTVKGPTQAIEQLRAGQTRIWGVISLTADDKANPGRYRYLTPRFNLPEGVRLVEQPEPIEFRLVPATADQPTP